MAKHVLDRITEIVNHYSAQYHLDPSVFPAQVQEVIHVKALEIANAENRVRVLARAVERISKRFLDALDQNLALVVRGELAQSGTELEAAVADLNGLREGFASLFQMAQAYAEARTDEDAAV